VKPYTPFRQGEGRMKVNERRTVVGRGLIGHCVCPQPWREIDAHAPPLQKNPADAHARSQCMIYIQQARLQTCAWLLLLLLLLLELYSSLQYLAASICRSVVHTATLIRQRVRGREGDDFFCRKQISRPSILSLDLQPFAKPQRQ